jgi:hypothetical protein
MRIAQAACNIFVDNQPFVWRDWSWGLPLIVLTVLIHVLGLLFIRQKVVHGSVGHVIERRHPKVAFVVVLGATTLLATCLHSIGTSIWALAYLFLGALPDLRSSLLYSLNAIDKLRAHESYPGRPLATPGSDGGAEWIAVVRADHRFSICGT